MALPDESTSSAPATHDVVVRRSPRYVRFIAVGIALAILISLILTFVFPEQPNYSRPQVFGFVGIILVTLFVGLSATIAVLVDRASSRRSRTIVMTTSEQVVVPEETGPDEFSPDESNPDESSPDEPNPDESNPDRSASN